MSSYQFSLYHSLHLIIPLHLLIYIYILSFSLSFSLSLNLPLNSLLFVLCFFTDDNMALSFCPTHQVLIFSFYLLLLCRSTHFLLLTATLLPLLLNHSPRCPDLFLFFIISSPLSHVLFITLTLSTSLSFTPLMSHYLFITPHPGQLLH